MKIKTVDLTGPSLDWAVAKCEIGDPVGSFLDGVVPHPNYADFHPSTDWSQGGPLVERENITIIRADDTYGTDEEGYCNNKRIPVWFAECDQWVGHTETTSYEGEYMEPTFMVGVSGGYYGPTPLIAAMRAYVASKLGDEIEIPDELISGEISPNKES